MQQAISFILDSKLHEIDKKYRSCHTCIIHWPCVQGIDSSCPKRTQTPFMDTSNARPWHYSCSFSSSIRLLPGEDRSCSRSWSIWIRRLAARGRIWWLGKWRNRRDWFVYVFFFV